MMIILLFIGITTQGMNGELALLFFPHFQNCSNAVYISSQEIQLRHSEGLVSKSE